MTIILTPRGHEFAKEYFKKSAAETHARERKPIKIQELESREDLRALLPGDVVRLDDGSLTTPWVFAGMDRNAVFFTRQHNDIYFVRPCDVDNDNVGLREILLSQCYVTASKLMYDNFHSEEKRISRRSLKGEELYKLLQKGGLAA